jgi:hypothetical protein
VHIRFRCHRHHEREVIDAFCEMRQRTAHPRPALASARKFEARLEHRPDRARGRFHARVRSRIKFLTVPRDELRFEIEKIHLARTAIHEKLNDAARFGGMMEAVVQQTVRADRPRLLCHAEQLRERDTAETAAELPKKLSARAWEPTAAVRAT